MIATFSLLGLKAAGPVRWECALSERKQRNRKKRKVRMIDIRIPSYIILLVANMQMIAF
jgi:hypothetical protein